MAKDTNRSKRDDDQDELEDEDESLDDEQTDNDDDEDHDDADADGDDDDESSRQRGESSDDELLERLVDRLDKAVEDRVGSALRGIRRDVRRLQRGNSTDDRGRKPRRDREDDRADRVPEADIRGARMAAKEYLSDEIEFLNADERALAMDMVRGEIAELATEGFDDEDEVGQEVARKVARRVKQTRKLYESSVVKRARRRGTASDRGGQPLRGSKRTTPATQWKEGEKLAADMYSGRRQSTGS